MEGLPLLAPRPHQVVHWPKPERILDLVIASVFFFGPLILTTNNCNGEGCSTGHLAAIWLFGLFIIIWVGSRITKQTFSLDQQTGVVTHTIFRGFGFIPVRTQTFKTEELGMMVLDSEQDSCGGMHCGKGCCLAFKGVYGTIGFPSSEQPVKVAFEIYCFYLWTHRTMCLKTPYITTFHNLCELLGFVYCYSEEYTQRPADVHTVGSEFYADLLHDLAVEDSKMKAALNSFKNYVALNIRRLQQLWQDAGGTDTAMTHYGIGKKVVQSHRMVYPLVRKTVSQQPGPV